MDRAWWLRSIEEVRRMFSGELLTSNHGLRALGLHPLSERIHKFTPYGNSGAGTIAVAHAFGAARIVLLGFDCQRVAGKVHWHGNHPKGLGNAGSLPYWKANFEKLRIELQPNVINATRNTALTCFPLQTLEQALEHD